MDSNYGWTQGPGERNVRLGWGAPNGSAPWVDHYPVGATIFQPSWKDLMIEGHTFYGSSEGAKFDADGESGFLCVPISFKRGALTSPFSIGSSRIPSRLMLEIFLAVGTLSPEQPMGTDNIVAPENSGKNSVYFC